MKIVEGKFIYLQSQANYYFIVNLNNYIGVTT